MKYILLLFCASLSFQVLALDNEGYMDCVVKESTVMFFSQDDKPYIQSAGVHRLTKGESFGLRYKYHIKADQVQLDAVDSAGQMKLTLFSEKSGASKIEGEREYGRGFFKIKSWYAGILDVTDNHFQIYESNGIHLNLQRYFKDDWHGILTYFAAVKGKKPLTGTYALDCYHKIDKVDQIIKYFEKVHLSNK